MHSQQSAPVRRRLRERREGAAAAQGPGKTRTQAWRPGSPPEQKASAQQRVLAPAGTRPPRSPPPPPQGPAGPPPPLRPLHLHHSDRSQRRPSRPCRRSRRLQSRRRVGHRRDRSAPSPFRLIRALWVRGVLFREESRQRTSRQVQPGQPIPVRQDRSGRRAGARARRVRVCV